MTRPTGVRTKTKLDFSFETAREEKFYISARRRGLVDLQVELQVMHSADGIRLIDLHGQRVSFAIAGEAFFQFSDMDRLVTVGSPMQCSGSSVPDVMGPLR